MPSPGCANHWTTRQLLPGSWKRRPDAVLDLSGHWGRVAGARTFGFWGFTDGWSKCQLQAEPGGPSWMGQNRPTGDQTARWQLRITAAGKRHWNIPSAANRRPG